ncbi:hypothetical protein IE53DRAFT_369667 [Violaceomyces palustris]|uniref:Uncharacterized protein n=1 Tax=Violaceomyces palustris TaxID=1673888 RepID=A0ACD0NUS7_9BASI|nr:hypothetical protein IE53DRAFT_369667 [Violaceomyces palustris]
MTVALFGEHLPDQFPAIASTLSSQLSLESDLSSFLADRAALERDYAAKLQSINKKYREKFSKRQQDYTVGSSPTREFKGEASTLANHVNLLIATTESTCSQHISLADSIEKVSNDMATSQKKREEIRKKHVQFSQKLLSDRDKVYNDRTRSKQKYDDLCHEVEAHRQKRERAEAGDRHADRAAKGFESARVDMWNGKCLAKRNNSPSQAPVLIPGSDDSFGRKNMYLISISLSNRAKDKFYREDLPALENSLQSLWTLTTRRIVSQLGRVDALLISHHEQLKNKVQELDARRQAVDPSKDQELYMEYNRSRWQEPANFDFEPCVGFFDTPEMSTEQDPRVYLQNRLIRCRARLGELQPLVESKRREVAGLENLKDAYEKQEGLGDPDEVMDNLFESLRQAFTLESEEALLVEEIECIRGAIGDDEGQARPHRFKPASFTIPTTCDYCGGTIWGIARQGFVCKPCGYTVHSKCEMKVPAECKSGPSTPSIIRSNTTKTNMSRSASTASSANQPRGYGRNLTATNTNTTTTTSSSSSAFSASSSPSMTSTTSLSPVGRMMYAFDATSPFELGVKQGEQVELIEDDEDSCGWIKVKSLETKKQGLVPTSYCDFGQDGSATEAIEPRANRNPEGGGGFVKALYDYDSQDAEEISLREGEVVELTPTGFGYGEGWCEGVKEGKVGIFPSNYVEHA